MSDAEFWTLIESTKKTDPDEHAEQLTTKLAKLEPKQILAFGRVWERLHTAAYSWPLWGAAYLINGGCSDDGFIDFRSWLLLRGEADYSAARTDPDTLAKLRIEPDEASCECYPATKAYGRATGQTDTSAYYDALKAEFGALPAENEPVGESWDFDDEAQMKVRLPKLFKKFGGG